MGALWGHFVTRVHRVQKVQKVQREVVAADAASFKGGDEFYHVTTCFDAWRTF